MENSKEDPALVEIGFSEWCDAVNRLLLDRYAVSIEDVGVDDEWLEPHWGYKELPLEFVLWFGVKYDLDPKIALQS